LPKSCHLTRNEAKLAIRDLRYARHERFPSEPRRTPASIWPGRKRDRKLKAHRGLRLLIGAATSGRPDRRMTKGPASA